MLLNKYKNMLSDALLELEIIEKNVAREVVFKGENTKPSNLDHIRRTIPKLIMLDVSLIKIKSSNKPNDPLLLEWLATAQAAGSKIVLVCDNEKALRKAAQIRNDLNKVHININGTFDLSQCKEDEVLTQIEEQLNFYVPNIEKNNCLFLDKNHRQVTDVDFIREAVKLEASNKINFESRDQLLHQLAYKYNFLSEHINFFNGSSTKAPQSAPFGFKTQGFKNSWLVTAVSIDNFAKNIFKWLKVFFAGTNVEANTSKDINKLKTYFNTHRNLNSLLNFPGVEAQVYQSNE